MNQTIRLSSSIIRASLPSTRSKCLISSSIYPPSLFWLQKGQTVRTNSSNISRNNPRIRRRRNNNITDDNVATTKENSDSTLNIESNPNMVRNKELFLDASNAFLTKAAAALEPMKAHNDIFNIQRSTNDQGEVLKIILKPSEGQYVLQVDNDLRTLNLMSPISGNYTYVLCKQTHEFIDMEDNHSLVGMLVRDLIRHCNGLPQF